METYDVIKRLCEENGIAMTALEQKLGFGRGSIGKLKTSSRSMTSERLQKVADFFGVSPEYLMTGEQPESYYVNPETADMAQKLYDNKDLRLLFDASRNATPEQLRLIRDLVLQMTKGNRTD